MILLIDNYDSFSYNLYQLIGALNPDIEVVRNNITINEIENLAPEAIIISPGPGKPSEAGICIEAIKYFASKLPILGICLGHQAIAEAFGGKITYADKIMHGKTSEISTDTTCPIFESLKPKIKVARYHSLVAEVSSLPKCLEITAKCNDGTIMGLKHKDYEVFGLQFHPESILTEDGEQIAKNFLGIIKNDKRKN